MLKRLLTWTAAIALTLSFTAHAADDKAGAQWQQDKSGVAWMAKKREYLIMNSDVFGYNYDITTAVKPEGEAKQIVVEIPVDKFSSGEPDRDSEVAVMLKGNTQKNMVFTSSPLDTQQWQQIIAKSAKSIAGDLSIGGKSYPVTFNVTYDSAGNLHGELSSKMTAFDIEPISLVGGLVVKVSDDIKLLVKLNLQDLAAAH